MQREQFYFRDLVLPIGHQCCTEFTGKYFWECDFHCRVKDFSQRFGKFSSHFSGGASESTVSCLILFVFLVKKYLKTWLRYILNDLRFRLKDDIIEAIMFQRCNTQTFCLPIFKLYEKRTMLSFQFVRLLIIGVLQSVKFGTMSWQYLLWRIS